MFYPFTPMLLKKIALELDISIEIEPEFGFAGEIVFKNGVRHLFHNATLNVNAAAAAHIANDKCYTCNFLRRHKLNVPVQKAFFAEDINSKLATHLQRTLQDAVKYANELGYPVFIKPNNLSQGKLVTKAYSDEQLISAGQQIFERNDVLLVEQSCPGRDYRVVVFDKKIWASYEREPLQVVGDSLSTIQQLVQKHQEKLMLAGRKGVDLDIFDPRIVNNLEKKGLSLESKPETGTVVRLLDNANLSSGGSSIDITDTIHPAFSELAIKAAGVIGLNLAGVDFLAEDLTKDPTEQIWNILEINASPGLENYSTLGERQKNVAEDLYKNILVYLSNK